jgi:heat shock protein beta-11
MPSLPVKLLLSTSSDDRFPATCAFDKNEKTFYLTTGMYPQELLLAFDDDAACNVTKITLVCHGVKKMRIDRCTEQYATNFEPLVDCEVNAAPEGALQRETYQVNKATIGANVRYVRFTILQGYEAFTAIHILELEGDKLG